MSSEEYERTTLWNGAFAPQSDGLDSQREKLVQAYREFRDRVAILLTHIQGELPSLTMHDITHVDALWRVASEIAGPDFSLNPAEAFVLGGAFLLHDAAHCRAAFPGGISELRQTLEWRDATAQRNLSEHLLQEGTEEFQAVLFDTLRILHPKQARNLAFAKWSDGSGNQQHLLPHDELRHVYGHMMGRISESHWFSPHELENFAEQTVTSPVCLAPAAWTVNPLKVAVLLRVADAAHIDARRAPRLLFFMNRITGISKEHWCFQEHLNQPHCDLGRQELVFSGRPFLATEQPAWWLAYEAACLADKELTAADHLLRDHGQRQLAAREVSGIRNPEVFARKVPTEGWHPVDASLRISQIQSVVERFGGAKLYGNEPHLAVRELLQNARDAVMASRALKALDDKEGSITVYLEESTDGDWLHVTDTGIGMSRYVLVHVLLDFGRSLWRDAALRREWPGLAATGFEAVGRFGIGFFSVFMLGNHVKVTTCRQVSSGENRQWVLEFLQGIESRPSLREPLTDESLTRHGTRVSVRLINKDSLLGIKKRTLDIFSGSNVTRETRITLAQLIGALAPALEVDVYTQEANTEKIRTIVAGDWREMEPVRLIDRIAPGKMALAWPWSRKEMDLAASNLSPIVGSNGEIQGRCAIVEHSDNLFGLQAGIVSVGGLYGGVINGLAGILTGKQAELLDRSVAIPQVEQEALAAWAENQATQLRTSNQLSWKKSAKALALGAKPEQLLVVAHGNEEWSANRLVGELNDIDEIWLLEDREYQYQSDCDEVLKADFENRFELDSRVFVIGNGVSSNEFIHSTNWPDPFFNDRITQPASLFEKIVNDMWPECEVIEGTEKVVGCVDCVPITRTVSVIYKRKHLASGT